MPDSLEDQLHPGTVEDVGRPEIDHQRPPIGLDRNVALAPGHLPGRIMASRDVRRRCLDGVAFHSTGARAGFALGPLAIEHQGDIVDLAKQHQPYKAPEPPIDRLQGRKVLRERMPAATRARDLADRVESLAQGNALPTAFARLVSAAIAIRSHSSLAESVGLRFVFRSIWPSGLASLVSTT